MINPSIRECAVRKSTGSFYDGTYTTTQDPALFHGWTKYPRCAIGDGSMVDWITLAIIERPDGKVDFCDPNDLTFNKPVGTA